MAEAAEDIGKDIFTKGPMLGTLIVSTYLSGALWADEHPMSNYDSRPGWMSALRIELDSLLTKLREAGPQDLFLEMTISSVFIKGASWAVDNPAPTL